jgi:hypothetical protein
MDQIFETVSRDIERVFVFVCHGALSAQNLVDLIFRSPAIPARSQRA